LGALALVEGDYARTQDQLAESLELSLVAHELTNRQIAETLAIGQRAVGNVLAKSGLGSRFLVRAWAVEHGLVPST
jgi:hypothetical protein